MRTLPMGARAFIPLAIAGAVIFALAPTTPASAASPRSTEAQQIIGIARKQVGDRYRHGASGPPSFDCSGLVIYAYKKAGDSSVIGRGKYRSARAMYRYFQRRGLASRSNPRPGDIVVWGGGTHVGIYVGGGKAISTLTNGVRVHGVHAVRAPFTAYLHTGMSGTRAKGTTTRHHVASQGEGVEGPLHAWLRQPAPWPERQPRPDARRCANHADSPCSAAPTTGADGCGSRCAPPAAPGSCFGR